MNTEPEIAKCRKCGEMHRVDEYRGVKHYCCPAVNRVMLLVQDEETPDESKEHKQ